MIRRNFFLLIGNFLFSMHSICFTKNGKNKLLQYENILKPVSKIVHAKLVHKRRFGLCIKALKYIGK